MSAILLPGTCIACGCTPLEPCLGPDFEPCAWAVQPNEAGDGLCTECDTPDNRAQLEDEDE